MTKKLYIVDLSREERQQLLELVQKGKVSARQLKRAHILLLASEGATDRAIADALHVGLTTVARIRQRSVEGNLEGVLCENPRRPSVCFDECPYQLIGEVRRAGTGSTWTSAALRL